MFMIKYSGLSPIKSVTKKKSYQESSLDSTFVKTLNPKKKNKPVIKIVY